MKNKDKKAYKPIKNNKNYEYSNEDTKKCYGNAT